MAKLAELEDIVSPWETWSQLLNELEANSDRILDQYVEMQEQYPDAAGALAITLAFVRYLGRTQALGANRAPDESPPQIDLPQLDRFCRRAPLMCACANGDTDACRALWPAGGGNGAGLKKWTDCKHLWELYQQARQRELDLIREAIGSGTVSVSNGELLQVESDAQRLRRALREAGCLVFRAAE